MSTLQRSRSTASISVLETFVLDHSLPPTQVVERSRLCSAAPRWRRFCAKSFSIPFHSIPLSFHFLSVGADRIFIVWHCGLSVGGCCSPLPQFRELCGRRCLLSTSHFPFALIRPVHLVFLALFSIVGGDCAHLSTTSRGSMRSSRPQRRRRTNTNTRTSASKSN